MIQVIVAVFVAVWFFRAARDAQKSGFRWMLSGLLVYVAPTVPFALLYRYIVIPAAPWFVRLGDDTAIWIVVLAGILPTVIGLAAVFLVHDKFLGASTAWPHRRRWRLAARLAVLIAVLKLLSPLAPSSYGWMLPAAMSPLVGLSSVLAQHGLTLAALVAMPILVLIIFRRRWFCHWMCPVGLLNEYAGKALPWWHRAYLRLPHVGQWLAVMTLVGAAFGYPLFAWLDPLALLTGTLSNAASAWSRPGMWIGALGLPIVLLLSFVWPRVWCARLCPLGGMQDLAAAAHRTPAVDDEPAPGRWPMLRRAMLFGVLGGLGAAVTVRRGKDAPGPLRPPGAAPADRFAGVCVRCGNCARVCKPGILLPDLGQHGVAALLTPVVSFEADYCREDCNLCGQVCPSGAIARLALPDKQQARIGVPKVDASICLLADDHECTICRNHCPYEAIRHVFSRKEYTVVIEIDLSKCPGCGACQAACPTSPRKAIEVHPA